MAQILTNTFFDDCEGIKMIAGKACLELSPDAFAGRVPEGVETLGQLLPYLGLSEGVGKNLNLLCGVYLHVTDGKKIEIFAPINVMTYPVGSKSETAVFLSIPSPANTSGSIMVDQIFKVASYLETPEDERLNCSVL